MTELIQGYAKNDQPCGDCRRFIPAVPLKQENRVLAFLGVKPTPKLENFSRCQRFHMKVDASYHMIHPVLDPCFEVKESPER